MSLGIPPTPFRGLRHFSIQVSSDVGAWRLAKERGSQLGHDGPGDMGGATPAT